MLTDDILVCSTEQSRQHLSSTSSNVLHMLHHMADTGQVHVQRDFRARKIYKKWSVASRLHSSLDSLCSTNCVLKFARQNSCVIVHQWKVYIISARRYKERRTVFYTNDEWIKSTVSIVWHYSNSAESSTQSCFGVVCMTLFRILCDWIYMNRA